ncbi:MAG: amino acid permease [Desulfurococcales archaeon]|nr:amino acid permease [Desulfurococcales archaeon]
MAARPRGEGIGFREAFSIGVGGMIGGGIFAVLGLSLELAGSAAPVAFALAGLVAGLTAYSYSKLTLRYPSRGGTVEFLVRAYGPGLLSGGLNVLLVLSYTVMIALYAYAFGSYGASSFGGGHLAARILGVAVILAFTGVNALGALVSGRVEDGLVFFKLSILVLVVAVSLPLIEWQRLSPAAWPPPSRIVAGGMIIFLAYEGFELIANSAADAVRVEDVARAFLASVAVVVAVYISVALVAAGALTPAEVIKARDYALAALAGRSLGRPGFLLVVAAALASTASAINATLYGTAGISYVVARYGQLPREIGRTIWGKAPEGLLLIALISSALTLGAGLEEISLAGSAGFLLIFTAVNLAAYKLRRQAKASGPLALAGALAALASLAVLLYHSYESTPGQVALFAALAASAFAGEALYRLATGRRIAEYVDPLLEERERLKRAWESWVPSVLGALRRLLGEFEAYLVGGVARGEHESSHDVDLLVVTPKAPAGRLEREARALEEEVRRLAGLPRHHPLHLHLATPSQRDEWLRRSRAHKPLHAKAEEGSRNG